MASNSPESGFGLRDWRLEDWPDVQFLRAVPRGKWNYFAERVRPLNDESVSALWNALFAGVRSPFHFKLATGWMADIFRRVISRNSDLRTGQKAVDAMATTLGWQLADMAFLVDSSHSVYAACWEDWLECSRRGWIPMEEFVLCSEATQRIALFWEGSGPFFGDRGKRKLVL